MGYPRYLLIDEDRGGVQHCISRCARGLRLITAPERAIWLISRLQLLTRYFAIDVCDFAALMSHIHLLLRTHPMLAMAWSAHEVAERWLTLVPPVTMRRRAGLRQAIELRGPPSEKEIEQAVSAGLLIEEWRWRLSNLGWFHRLLKEPCARTWNREDGAIGSFWQGRFRSIACLDDESVLMQAAYVLLNPVHCGSADELDRCKWTTLPQRLDAIAREIQQGAHADDAVAYGEALLYPAMPCVPGAQIVTMDNAEWSTRVTQGLRLRAARTSAIDDASDRLALAARFDPATLVEFAGGVDLTKSSKTIGVIADCGERSLANAEPIPEGQESRGETTASDVSATIETPADDPSSRRFLAPCARLSGESLRLPPPRRAARRPPPIIPLCKDGQTPFVNPWRDRASLPMVEGVTLTAFIEFVDDWGRVERADKPCRIASDAPRAIAKLRAAHADARAGQSRSGVLTTQAAPVPPNMLIASAVERMLALNATVADLLRPLPKEEAGRIAWSGTTDGAAAAVSREAQRRCIPRLRTTMPRLE